MRKDVTPDAHAGGTRRARDLRRGMSLPEVLLWRVLRARPDDLKFRRQHPTGAYVLDFYCNDARLAIEVDGETHAHGDRPARDRQRDAWLGESGVTTLRIAARDVLRDCDAVVVGIVAACRARLPLHHSALPNGPPPRAKLGED